MLLNTGSMNSMTLVLGTKLQWNLAKWEVTPAQTQLSSYTETIK